MHAHLLPAFLRPAVVLAAVLAGACAAEFDGDDSASLGDSFYGDDTAPPDTGRDSGSEETPPEWRRLSAEVLVEDGSAVADESSLQVALLGPEAEGFPEVCSGTWAVASLTAEPAPDDAVLAWWQVVPGPQEGDCKDGALPASFQFGIGVLHPDVAALLAAQGWTGASEVLYGAYVRLPDPAQLWTFGYAWTREGVDAGTPASTTPPLPDGAWQVVPVYLLPA